MAAPPATPGVALIEEVMGPPGAAPASPPKAAPDANEADEGGEGEIETHLRAMEKAKRGGDMTGAAAAFKAAVHACLGSGYEDME